MDIPDALRTVYSARLNEKNGRYYLTVPAREIESDTLRVDETYKLGILNPVGHSADHAGDKGTDGSASTKDDSPPVSAGERRTVTIEGIGDKGDGIARIDRGYVLIVPETDVNERVTVEVDQARDNVGFASVIKRHAESG
jgi:predicted RNA-binding protein with TRAM domain